VDRDAPVVVSDEILVHAPVEVVWDLQTDVSDWPAWRTGIESAELVGRFEVGATFHWATGGLESASTIEQARRHRRAAWGGPASGIMGMRVWEFTPEAGGTRVATVESWAGAHGVRRRRRVGGAERGRTAFGRDGELQSRLRHTYAARLRSTAPTNGDSKAAQTITAPSGSKTLSFWYNVTCPDTVTYDWATATLKDNTANTTKTVLAKTCVSSSGWKQVSTSLTSGHSYTLTLTSHDDNYAGDPTYTLYDDVAVS
jgi:hypothetical protein